MIISGLSFISDVNAAEETSTVVGGANRLPCPQCNLPDEDRPLQNFVGNSVKQLEIY